MIGFSEMKILPFLLLVAMASAADFFPPGSLASTESRYQGKAEWYASCLLAMGEQPMFSRNLPKDIEQYRFTWLRSFHRPVIMRAEATPDGGVLVIKVGHAEEDTATKILREERRKISRDEMNGIRMHFKVTDFFAQPSFEESRVGNDGAQWVIEALMDGRYHVVALWSPDDRFIRRIGMHFIELAIGGDFVPIY